MTINRSIADLLRSHATIETTAHTAASAGNNLLINGSMAVAQRGSQTAVGAADGDRTACDMWKVLKRGSPEGRVTATQTADTNMNLNGHEYTCKLDCTTAEGAVASDEGTILSQSIEGHNLQGLKYGTANAEAATLSFWFSSPKTGIHCVGLYLSDTGYSQIKEFTIASANTWEYFALTFSANTSNKINNDTGRGMMVNFPLTAGSNFQVSANAWASGEDFATSNQQNLLDNTANNVSLAGVQLEIGSVATSFAYEDIGTTVAKCQRYLIRWVATEGISFIGSAYSTTAMQGLIFFPEMRRAAGTFSISAGSDFKAYTATLSAGNNFSTLTDPGSDGYKTQRLQGTGTSGIVAGYAINCVSSNTNAWMQISREL